MAANRVIEHAVQELTANRANDMAHFARCVNAAAQGFKESDGVVAALEAHLRAVAPDGVSIVAAHHRPSRSVAICEGGSTSAVRVTKEVFHVITTFTFTHPDGISPVELHIQYHANQGTQLGNFKLYSVLESPQPLFDSVYGWLGETTIRDLIRAVSYRIWGAKLTY